MTLKLDNEVLQTAAVTSIAGSILTWWPLFLAIPGAVYYCLLIAEKVTGKSVKDWFKKNEES